MSSSAAAQQLTPVEPAADGRKPQAASRKPEARKPPQSTELVVELVEGRDAFLKLEKQWNAALAAGPRDEPMLRHEWLRAHVENFTPSAPLRVFVARAGNEIAAAVALVEKKERSLDTCYLPMTTWELPANDHSQRGGILLGKRWEEALPLLWQQIVNLTTWDRIFLRDLPEGEPDWRLRDLANASGHLFGMWTSLHSPYLPLPEGKGPARFEQVEKKVDAKFRANLRRRKKKLAEKGEVKYLRVDNKDAAKLDVALADFFDIEASGWKGQGGTAIALDPKLVGFYTQIARDAAKRGALHLSFLECGGKRIAGHLAIAHGGRFFLVKVGYDEAFREFSPGQQLAADAIRASCDAGLREFDFLGPCMDWKLDWEPRLRTHTWLTILRPTRAGKLVHAARFVAWPLFKAAKERVAELRAERVTNAKNEGA